VTTYDLFTYLRLSTDHAVDICTSLYHLPGNVISVAVGLVLVYINLQEEYESFLA